MLININLRTEVFVFESTSFLFTMVVSKDVGIQGHVLEKEVDIG